MLVEARRTIGITNIDDFYKLTPNEFRDLQKGAQLALYDDLYYSQIKASMVRPIALIDNPENQTQNVTQIIEQIKQVAETGNDQFKHKVDMNDFYNLLLKKGGNE